MERREPKRRAPERTSDPDELSDAKRLLHDLHVHQSELEAQNESLRQAQIAIELSNNRYAELFDFAPVGYCNLDLHGTILDANITAATMFGRPRNTLVGRPFASFREVVDSRPVREHLLRCRKEQKDQTFLLEIVAEGGRRDLQVAMSPATTELGGVGAVRMVLTDITRQKQVELELQQSHERETQLRRRFEALDHAMASISKVLASLPSLDRSALLKAVADEARVVSDAEHCALSLEGGAERAFSGISADAAARIGFPPRPRGVLNLAEHREVLEVDPAAGRCAALRNLVSVSLSSGGRKVGELYVANKAHGEEFTTEDRRILELFCDRIGIMFELARLRDLERREASRREVVVALSAALSRAREATLIASAAARATVPAFADCCAVFRSLDGALHLEAVAPSLEAFDGSDLGSALAESARSGTIAKAFRDRRSAVTERREPFRSGSALIVPILAGERAFGVVVFARSPGRPPCGDPDLATAEDLASRIAAALETAQLVDALRRTCEELEGSQGPSPGG